MKYGRDIDDPKHWFDLAKELRAESGYDDLTSEQQDEMKLHMTKYDQYKLALSIQASAIGHMQEEQS